MKKLLAAALCAMLVAGLAAGCGSKGNDAGNENNNAASGTDSNAPATKVIDIDLTEEQYAFGVDKDQPELLEQVNTFINKIMEDGTLDEICDKYFGDGEPTAVESAELDTSKISSLSRQTRRSSRLSTQRATLILESTWRSRRFWLRNWGRSLSSRTWILTLYAFLWDSTNVT